MGLENVYAPMSSDYCIYPFAKSCFVAAARRACVFLELSAWPWSPGARSFVFGLDL